MNEFVSLMLISGLVYILFVEPAPAGKHWDLPNEYPASSVPGKTAEIFAHTLERLSGGSIEIRIHHGSALGFNSADHFEAVGGGAVELASSSSSRWGGIHCIFQLSSLPFLTLSQNDVLALYMAAKPGYETVLEDNNQVLLFATPWPPSGIWARKPVNSMDALRGLKIRTYDTFGTRTLRAVGASPIQLSWIDIIPQLTTGSINAVLTSAEGGSTAGFGQYLPYFTEINYASPLQFVHMNNDVYDSLSGTERDWIAEAANVSEMRGFQLLSARVAENYEQMQQNDVSVIKNLQPAFLHTLREGGRLNTADWKSCMGGPGEAILDTYYHSHE